jgi:hypothetical protein
MLTYPNVSPAQIEAMKERLEAEPETTIAEVAPDQFKISSGPFSVSATYQPDTQVLLVDANWLIRGRVNDAIKQALGRV